MKAHQLIARSLQDWRAVDAPELARELFDELDQDELERLALRAFTEEVRGTLRRKDANGVPAYGNLELVDPASGKVTRHYKQTALFDVGDYQVAIRACYERAEAERRTGQALQLDCARRHGVQLRLDGASA